LIRKKEQVAIELFNFTAYPGARIVTEWKWIGKWDAGMAQLAPTPYSVLSGLPHVQAIYSNL